VIDIDAYRHKSSGSGMDFIAIAAGSPFYSVYQLKGAVYRAAIYDVSGYPFTVTFFAVSAKYLG
jgi:hypothetical protein